MNVRATERGFIALVSVVILSFVLLIAALSLSQFGITSRFFLIDFENKALSEQLALGCVQSATVDIALYETSYNPSDEKKDFPLSDESCFVESVTSIGNVYTIRTYAIVDGATTNIEAVWNNTTETITSQEEIEIL